MLNYFEEQIRRCEEQEQQRITEDRKDEANLQKIRANIFRVFQSVYKRSLKEAQPEVFFRKKLETIPQNWREAYEKASIQEDAVSLLIEQTKLEAAKEIRKALDKEALT